MLKPYTFLGNDKKICYDDSEFDLESVLHKHAMDKNRIYLWSDIDDGSAGVVIAQLHYMYEVKNVNHIDIIIHSSGGDVDGLTTIIDEMQVMQSLGITISTVAIGNAYSAAAVILSLGTKGYRFARPNTNIMFHPLSYGTDSDYVGQQEKISAFLKKKNDIINRMVAKAIGKEDAKQFKKFVADIDKGLWLTAEDAVKYGIIDGILSTPLPYKGEINAETENYNKSGI